MKNEFKNMDALSYLHTLDNNSVDLILTDPPYAISKETGFKRGEKVGDDRDRFRMDYNFGEWDTVDLSYFEQVFALSYKKLRKGGSMVVFYDQWKLQELKQILEHNKFKMLRQITWIKTNPVPINSKRTYLSNAKEYAISCVKGGSPTFNEAYHKGDFNYPIYHSKDRFHTTQKSLPLFEELIEIHTNEGDLVVDMFSGSATTQVAAFNKGRFFGGCELDKDYYEKSIDRLKEIGVYSPS